MSANSLRHASRQYRDTLKACEADGKKLSDIQRYMFEIGSNIYRFHKNESLSLIGFLCLAASDAYADGFDDDEAVDGRGLVATLSVFSKRAMHDILNKTLIIRDLVSGIPMNNDPDVISWCSSGDDSEMPEAHLVVRRDEAIAWLKSIKANIPRGLASNDAALPVAPSASGKRNKKTPVAFESALYELFASIKKRAVDKGIDFDPMDMPGTIADFQEVAKKINEVFDCALSSFSDYRKGHCKFPKGRGKRPGECPFYRDLFPEFF